MFFCKALDRHAPQALHSWQMGARDLVVFKKGNNGQSTRRGVASFWDGSGTHLSAGPGTRKGETDCVLWKQSNLIKLAGRSNQQLDTQHGRLWRMHTKIQCCAPPEFQP